MPEIAEASGQAAFECVHRWILRSLQDSRGVTVGSCKLCGETREFTNEANRWRGTHSAGAR